MQTWVSARRGSQRSKVLALSSAGVAFFCVFLASERASAAEYYVSPTGSDSNPGTLASPFATLQKGNNSAAAGDTVWLRGGTYYSTTQITLSGSGTSDSNRTKIWAYQGEVPVLDFSKYASTNPAVDVPAILVTGSWMHLKGLEIANGAVGVGGDHSYSMLRTKSASNNTFELLNIHHGFGPGLFIDTGTGGNLILNCDSHDNYDKDGSQGDGQNGDGFGVHYQTTGPSTIIRGCRAWHNSDDGYDFIYQEVPVTIENSWATGCGYGTAGNGNGFKIGSSGTG
ncbi:MAG TPA: right-handed parallel beta-helix repeat-containing protein, partial [Polyangia bacterium]